MIWKLIMAKLNKLWKLINEKIYTKYIWIYHVLFLINDAKFKTTFSYPDSVPNSYIGKNFQ